MSKQNQVAIIGAGISGLVAGITLIKNGVDCTIIERSEIPRDKACGGIITQKAIDLMVDIGIGDFRKTLNYVSENKYYIEYNGKHILTVEHEIPFSIVNRFGFDMWLIDKFKRLGGNLISGISIDNIDTKNRKINFADWSCLYYNTLIVASGALRLPGLLSGHKFNTVLGVQAAIDRTMIDSDLVIDFGKFKDGYVWEIPHYNDRVIGFASSDIGESNSIDYLKNYIYDNYTVDDINVKGAFIPYGGKTESPIDVDENIMYVGDAAGLADSCTGEGIYMAVYSGFVAAKSIVQSFGVDNAALLLYWIRTLKLRRWKAETWALSRVFYKFKKFFLKLAKLMPSKVSFITDNMICTMPYGFSVVKIALACFIPGLRKYLKK